MFKFFKKIYILLVTVPFFIVVSVQFYGKAAEAQELFTKNFFSF